MWPAEGVRFNHAQCAMRNETGVASGRFAAAIWASSTPYGRTNAAMVAPIVSIIPRAFHRSVPL